MLVFNGLEMKCFLVEENFLGQPECPALNGKLQLAHGAKLVAKSRGALPPLAGLERLCDDTLPRDRMAI